MVDVLGGRHLVTPGGAWVEAEAALQNKVVALYFGAVRCDFYVDLVEQARRPAPLAVVFVSTDSAQEMQDFMRLLPGSWLALPFHDPYWHELRTRYRITATPKLVILKPSGEVITDKGQKQIREQGRACIQNWAEAADIFQNFSG
ncbi:nucleoredoxin-like protein 2 [Molossus nigricans]